MATTTSQVNGTPKKKLILNAFVESCSGHQSPGLWRHPQDRSAEFNDIYHWVELAKLLESAHFHGIFIADVLPYHLARRLSTVDHLSGGRVGWNIVTGYLDSAARNLGLTEQPLMMKDTPLLMNTLTQCISYAVQIYRQSSWRDDAVKLDRERGIYTDPALVRPINHVGKYYTVPGPHVCQPSPQRTPFIMQAGTSKAGKAFSAKNAEAIFVAGHSPSVVAKNIADIRAAAKDEYSRDPSTIKFLAMFCPIIGKTQEEADAKYLDYIQYGSEDGALALFGGWTGIDLAQYDDDQELRHVESNAIRSAVEAWSKASPQVPKWTKRAVAKHIQVGGLGTTVIGTPEKVADEMERWVREADIDGFNIAYALWPQTFQDVIDLLIPVLKERGLFWDGYAVDGGTYRENLYGKKGVARPPSDHPAAKYHWKA
ncbi:hypothetical protein ACSS6W_009003 [Trichoderma asperelloides]